MIEKARELLLVLLLVLSCICLLLGIAGGIAAMRWASDTAKRTNAILTHIDAVAARAQRTMGKLEEASARQKELTDLTIGIMVDLDSDVKAAYETIDRTNRLITQANEQVKGIGEDADEIQIATVRTMEDVKRAVRPVPELLSDADVMVNSLTRVISGPDVAGTLHEVAQASGDVHGMTSNLNETSRDLKNYVDRAVKPAGAVKSLFLRLLGPVATFLGTHF